jgi:MtN3 and saliva related transmembrane protein
MHDLFDALKTPEPLGWLASLILLSTIARQIWRQAHAPTVEGVSKWLFIGQMAASALYLTYSVLVGNVVFIASNAALLAAGITGQVIYWRRKQRQASDTVAAADA